MITKQELEEAIAECESGKSSYQTCEKLATFYTVHEHLYGTKEHVKPEEPSYSFGGSEFMDTIQGRDLQAVMGVMDELMETLSVINPRLYDGVLRKLAE